MRTDTASRIIKATPQRIYDAFLDPNSVASWRPPKGMTARIYAFEAREGGRYRMAFLYKDAKHQTRGKTSEHADVFDGRFVKLEPGKRIVEEVKFESEDPGFADAMRITTTLTSVLDGTEVRSVCENVPPSIKPEDHQAGMASTLENLAAFVE
jgi:uncharacterized protein YndB with AHSA1/START domain